MRRVDRRALGIFGPSITTAEPSGRVMQCREGPALAHATPAHGHVRWRRGPLLAARRRRWAAQAAATSPCIESDSAQGQRAATRCLDDPSRARIRSTPSWRRLANRARLHEPTQRVPGVVPSLARRVARTRRAEEPLKAPPKIGHESLCIRIRGSSPLPRWTGRSGPADARLAWKARGGTLPERCFPQAVARMTPVWFRPSRWRYSSETPWACWCSSACSSCTSTCRNGQARDGSAAAAPRRRFTLRQGRPATSRAADGRPRR